MVTVGLNKDGTITIAGKEATQQPKRELLMESVTAIKIKNIEEAVELVTQLLYTIRKQAHEQGYIEGIKTPKE